MKKYFANMNVNGTHYRPDLEDTNWRRLAADIARSAKANCPLGNEFSWKVWDENDIIVAAGSGYKKQNGNFGYYDVSYLIGNEV